MQQQTRPSRTVAANLMRSELVFRLLVEATLANKLDHRENANAAAHTIWLPWFDLVTSIETAGGCRRASGVIGTV
jgi:hypothetical protein